MLDYRLGATAVSPIICNDFYGTQMSEKKDLLLKKRICFSCTVAVDSYIPNGHTKLSCISGMISIQSPEGT